ncbi:MAG TPA: carbon-nitrogen family hydrolase [Methanosarcinaceae archaeon]|nr:carbon-nitrogen family hydrolase [Methanosarcinaceae archaeon]
MTHIKAACIQMDISHCSKQTNISKAISMAENATSDGAKLIVLPEVFSTGFCYGNIEEVSERSPYPTIEALSDFSKKHDCILIGSILGAEVGDKESLLYSNLGFCIEFGDLAGTYKKTHIFGMEKSYFTSGDTILPIKLKKSDITIGLEICYELRFPEVARKLTLAGADILITIAEFPDPKVNVWKSLATSRAIENQIPHIACNRSGIDPYSSFFGGSMITNAWGEVKAEAGKDECIIMHDIDLDETNKIRKAVPLFKDRRLDIY